MLLFSFLLNLWAPLLVAIGTCETRETMTLLRGLFGGVRPWVAKTSHAKWLRPVTAKRAHNQARSQGGGGWGVGRTTPPPVAHPQDFVPPFSNFVPPFSNFVPPFTILFHPLAILFHPWNVDDVTRAMSKGGGACECPRVGAFFKLMTSRGQCPRGGGAPGVPPIQVQTPPTWLAGYGPDNQGRNVHISNSTTPIVLILVSGDS